MNRIIYHNNSILDKVDSYISSMSSGVLYGWGVFTTIKVYKGNPLFFDRHWTRVNRDSKKIGIELKYSYREVKDAIKSIISKNSVLNGKIRITIIKGSNELWNCRDIKDDFLIFTDDLKEDKDELKISISPFRINSNSPITGIKSTTYINNIISLKEAKNRGFDEAIVLNEKGYIAEAIMANIFWIKDKVVYTPSLDTGCLPGITREIVLEIIKELLIDFREERFELNDINGAKEVFLTSSIKGIKPVRYIDNRALEINKNGLTSKIINRFKEIVDEEYICGYNK